jgi:hypothetical protein
MRWKRRILFLDPDSAAGILKAHSPMSPLLLAGGKGNSYHKIILFLKIGLLEFVWKEGNGLRMRKA